MKEWGTLYIKKLMGTKELRNRDPNFNEIGTQSQNRDPFYY